MQVGIDELNRLFRHEALLLYQSYNSRIATHNVTSHNRPFCHPEGYSAKDLGLKVVLILLSGCFAEYRSA